MNDWKTGTHKGYYYQAVIFDEGSIYGIDGGRISKLSICKGDKWAAGKEVYSCDRGLDFNNMPAEDLQDVISHIESMNWTPEEILKREG